MARQKKKYVSQSSAWGTAPPRSSRESSSTRMRRTMRQVPGIMHTRLGGYHIRDIEFTLGIDVNVTKVGKDLSEAIFAEPNNTYKFADVPKLNVPVVRGMTHDGLGKYLAGSDHQGPRPHGRHRQAAQGHKDRCGRQLPAGRLRDGDQVVRGAGHRSGLRLRQRHPGVHCLLGILGQALPRCQAAHPRR